jgi:tetratricopeptide (TPR) repeat protein
MATKKDIIAAKELLEALKEIKQLNKDNRDLTEAQAETFIKHANEHGNIEQAIAHHNQSLKKLVAEYEKVGGALKEEIKLLETQLAQLEKRNEKGRLNKEIAEAQREIAAKNVQIAEKHLLTLEEGTEEYKKQLEEVEKLRDEVKKLTEEEERKKKFEDASNKAKKKAIGLLDGIVGRVFRVAQEAFNAQKAFEKAFQLPESYTQDLSDLHDQLASTGIMMKDLTDSTGDLISTVTEFTRVTETERKALQTTTAQLSKLGVASKDVATGVQTSMKIFGQSAMGAERTARELFSVSRELGVVPGQMAAEYAKMGPQLAKFGQEGIRTFKELSRIQKLTGFEMGKLIQITSKFDTFEGAAEATGKLNAALGGNFVNAMDMMMETDPAARFETIRGAIEDAGLSFDTMSYYQKQFYANSLGLENVGDLALMLSGRTDLMTDATNQSAASYEEMAERQKAQMNFQEQFNALIAENADGILSAMHAMIKITAALSKFAGVIEFLIPVMIGWKALTFMLGVANLWFGTTQEMVAKTGWKMIGPMVGVAAALGLVAAVMMFSSPSKLVLGLFGLGVAFFALGKALRASNPALAQAGPAIGSFGTGLLTVAGAISMVIVSIGLLAAGIGFMAEGFAKMFAAVEIPKLIALGVFFAAAGMGAIVMVAAAIGILAFSGAMVALGFALWFVNGEKLASIATIMESMAVIDFAAWGEAGPGMKGIAKGIDTLSPARLRTLQAMAPHFDALGASVLRAAGPMELLVSQFERLDGEALVGVQASLKGVVDELNRTPTLKTVLLTAGMGALGFAAASMAPLVMAFAAGGGAVHAAIGERGGTTQSTAAASGGGGTQRVKVDVEFNTPLFEAKVREEVGKAFQE